MLVKPAERALLCFFRMASFWWCGIQWTPTGKEGAPMCFFCPLNTVDWQRRYIVTLKMVRTKAWNPCSVEFALIWLESLNTTEGDCAYKIFDSIAVSKPPCTCRKVIKLLLPSQHLQKLLKASEKMRPSNGHLFWLEGVNWLLTRTCVWLNVCSHSRWPRYNTTSISN